MKVFLSWSGTRSNAVAQALKDWLPLCIQSLDPWMSSADIDKGARWFDEIETAIESADGLGIFCVTPENISSPWLNFEAGVVASKGGKSRVCALLIDIAPVDLKPPISLFQVTNATKDDIYKLLQSLNKQSAKPVAEHVLERAFNSNWDELEASISTACESVPKIATHSSSVPDAIAELVGITRRMERTLAEQGSHIRRLAHRGRPTPAVDISAPTQPHQTFISIDERARALEELALRRISDLGSSSRAALDPALLASVAEISCLPSLRAHMSPNSNRGLLSSEEHESLDSSGDPS